MRIYGIINEGSDDFYISLINIDKYSGDKPIIFVDIEEDEAIPIFTYEDIFELLDIWSPYSGKINTVEFGTFDTYGDFTPNDDYENNLTYRKICEYDKGILKKVTYEKV